MNRLSVVLLLVIAGLLSGPAAHAQLLTTSAATADVSASLAPSYDDDLLVGVANRGPSVVDASVTVDLPPGIGIVAAPAGCVLDGNRLTCRSDDLMPDAYTTFPVDIVQTERTAQRLTAAAAGNLEDPSSANDRASLTVQRLAAPATGEDVVAAAVAVSALRFPDGATTGRVVLSRDDRFADALAGTPLTTDAPLLYTPTAALDGRTANEIDRLLPAGGEVVVLGGPAAISDAVVGSLASRGHRVERLAGDSRIGTALAVADRVAAAHGTGATVVVARADGEGTAAWADAVAVGGYAAMTRTPVLLTPTAVLPAEVTRWLAAQGTTRTLVIGGESAVAATATTHLPGAVRVAGTDRAGTAVAIAGLYPSIRAAGDRRFHLVNGYAEDGWAYGLVAAGLAADEDAPVLFVDTDTAPDSTMAAVSSCRDNPVPIAVVGSDRQVAASLYMELDRLDVDRC